MEGRLALGGRSAAKDVESEKLLLEPSSLSFTAFCGSLSSAKQCRPGQAATGIRSLPGHAAVGSDSGGESPGGSPAACESLCSCVASGTALPVRHAAGRSSTSSGKRFVPGRLVSVSSAGGKGDLCFVPSGSASG